MLDRKARVLPLGRERKVGLAGWLGWVRYARTDGDWRSLVEQDGGHADWAGVVDEGAQHCAVDRVSVDQMTSTAETHGNHRTRASRTPTA